MLAWVFSGILAILGSGLMYARFKIRSTKSCQNGVLMTGKTVLITGGNDGIGKAVALEMAKRNACVIITGRDDGKSHRAVADIRTTSGNIKVYSKHLDLGNFDSVRGLAKELIKMTPRLDILIENAAYLGPLKLSADGYEWSFTVNHLGHFLLFQQLLPIMFSSVGNSRLIVVASDAYKIARENFVLSETNWITSPLVSDYHSFIAYGRSKLANILFATEANKRHNGNGITAYAVHPGATRTGLFNNWSNSFWKCFALKVAAFLLFRSPDDAAQTIVFCASEPNLKADPDFPLFADCTATDINFSESEKNLGKHLWVLDEKLCGYTESKTTSERIQFRQ